MSCHVFRFLPQEISELLSGEGFPKYRSEQLLNWIYRNRQIDPSAMTNLSAELKRTINQELDFDLPEIIDRKNAADGTAKYLLRLIDGNLIEMVIIPAAGKNTLCLSTQVGCKRGCRFCATAELGFKRNLEVEEIVAQVWLAIDELKDSKLTNIVFMGMGEPLDNADNVIKAVRILQHEKCLSFSPRRITISTCGVIPGIQKLAESGIKVKLAVSLNAAIQSKREQLMPVSRQYPLSELKKTLLDFRQKTAFRITFEYVMIKDFNLGKEDVKALLKFLGDISCKLNVIKWNEVKGLPYEPPSEHEVLQFISAMERLSSAITYRKSRGAEIAAACGQLAGKY